MKFYMAPMEGVTGYLYRQAYQSCFHQVDQFYTPFLTGKNLSSKERNDILPEHNKGMHLVPQVLTKSAQDFLFLAQELKQYGYQELNLNLGCPSQTVTAKGKGAGFLAYPEELERFLDEIFSKSPVDISIKTRIGVTEEQEWEGIWKLYQKYPLKELVIHPRLQKDFYKYSPRMDAFAYAYQERNHGDFSSDIMADQEGGNSHLNGQKEVVHDFPLCYNGDIVSVETYENFCRQFPKTQAVMLGRGLIANPGLVGELRGMGKTEKTKLREFHDLLYDAYQSAMSGDKNLLYRMKELWCYLGVQFPNSPKVLKQIKKSNTRVQYESAVDMLFQET